MKANKRAYPLGTPSSEVGMEQEAGTCDGNQHSPILHTEHDKWKNLVELQHRNMMELIKTVIEPMKHTRKLVLPEFNPDNTDTDTLAWCNTVDICLKDNPVSGSQLILLLSRSLKGSAASWLVQNSHSDTTWSELRELFLTRFHQPETPAATFHKILSGKPNDGENIATYVSRLLNTVMTRSQNMTVEQVVIGIILAHVARSDTQIQRMAFTTEIPSRVKLQQELQPFIYRKTHLPPPEKPYQPTDAKKPRLERRCHNCGKTGHLSYDCRGNTSKDCLTSTNVSHPQFTPSSTLSQRKELAAARPITCFRCGEPGHIAPRYPQREKKPEDCEEPPAERRVNICAIQPATDYLYNLGDDCEAHEDV